MVKNLLHQAENFVSLVEIWSLKTRFARALPIVLVALSLFSAFPSYDLIPSEEFSSTWDAIIRQTEYPLANAHYDPLSHEANLVFRLTPVVIGHLLGFTDIKFYLLLQLICLIALFLTTTKLFEKLLGRGASSVLLSASVAFIFTGNVLCSDYRGFFDVVAFLLMMVACLSEQPFIIFASAFLAFFTDERALIASSLIYIFFVLDINRQPSTTIHLKQFFTFTPKIKALVISWIAYLACRFALGYFFDLRSNSVGMIEYLLNFAVQHANVAPFAIWTGLEGFWLVTLLGTAVLFYQKEWLILICYWFAIFIVVFVALWTFDITRSMAYLFPAIFVSLRVLTRTESKRAIQLISLCTLILCILPTYYAGGPDHIQWFFPFPMQVFRMLIG